MKLGMIDPNTNDINTDMDLDIGSTLARLDRYFHLNAQGFPTFAPSTCPLKSI